MGAVIPQDQKNGILQWRCRVDPESKLHMPPKILRLTFGVCVAAIGSITPAALSACKTTIRGEAARFVLRLVLLSEVFLVSAAQGFAEDGPTYPASKFPFCVTVRTKTLECDRVALADDWKCHPRTTRLALPPRCVEWATPSVALECKAWTDGAFYYGSLASKIIPIEERAAEPIFICIGPKTDHDYQFNIGTTF
jgi:hypothetical protein